MGSIWYLEIKESFATNFIENESAKSISKSILPLLKKKPKQNNNILMSLALDSYRNNFKRCNNLTYTNSFGKIQQDSWAK